MGETGGPPPPRWPCCPWRSVPVFMFGSSFFWLMERLAFQGRRQPAALREPRPMATAVVAGPFFYADGTLNAAEKDKIFAATKVSASIRQRQQWQQRRGLTLSGPSAGIEEARRMADAFIKANAEAREKARLDGTEGAQKEEAKEEPIVDEAARADRHAQASNTQKLQQISQQRNKRNRYDWQGSSWGRGSWSRDSWEDRRQEWQEHQYGHSYDQQQQAYNHAWYQWGLQQQQLYQLQQELQFHQQAQQHLAQQQQQSQRSFDQQRHRAAKEAAATEAPAAAAAAPAATPAAMHAATAVAPAGTAAKAAPEAAAKAATTVAAAAATVAAAPAATVPAAATAQSKPAEANADSSSSCSDSRNSSKARVAETRAQATYRATVSRNRKYERDERIADKKNEAVPYQESRGLPLITPSTKRRAKSVEVSVDESPQHSRSPSQYSYESASDECAENPDSYKVPEEASHETIMHDKPEEVHKKPGSHRPPEEASREKRAHQKPEKAHQKPEEASREKRGQPEERRRRSPQERGLRTRQPREESRPQQPKPLEKSTSSAQRTERVLGSKGRFAWRPSADNASSVPPVARRRDMRDEPQLQRNHSLGRPQAQRDHRERRKRSAEKREPVQRVVRERTEKKESEREQKRQARSDDEPSRRLAPRVSLPRERRRR